MLNHDESHQPEKQPERHASLAKPLQRNQLRLRRVEVFIPDSSQDAFDETISSLSRLLKAFHFTFQNDEARREVAATLATALISETRLNDSEMFRIQSSLTPSTSNPSLSHGGKTPPLYGISVSCFGGIEVLVDPLDAGSTLSSQCYQEIRLSHVELNEYEELENSWEHDPDAWRNESDGLQDSHEPTEIAEIESPYMALEYDSDPANPGITCSVLFDPEESDEDPENDWKSCNYFLRHADLPIVPRVIDTSWNAEKDANDPYILISKGNYTLEVEKVEPSTTTSLSSSSFNRPKMHPLDFAEYPLAKSGHVSLWKPTHVALRDICAAIGIPEAAELIATATRLSRTDDNPSSTLRAILARLGGGQLEVREKHYVDSSVCETCHATTIELPNTPVGAIDIQISLGGGCSLSVYPPMPHPGDSSESLSEGSAKMARASNIPWDRIRDIARDFGGEDLSDE